jgi:Na+-driven multidrug efflux pump
LRNFSNMIFLRLIAAYGTDALAAAGIGFRIYSFVIMPIWGLMMGSGIVVGHNLGANQVDKAKKAVFLTTLNGLIVILVLAIPIMLFPKTILSLFMGGAEPTYFGTSLMRIIAPALIAAVFIGSIGSAFTGAGLNKPLLRASFIGQWIVLVPYALIVSFLFKADIAFLWAALLLGDIVELAVIALIYKNSKWYLKRV